jgi:GDP-D-mannose dehydratase
MNNLCHRFPPSTEQKTLLIFGIGKLGGSVIDVLALRHPEHRFVMVSRTRALSERRVNLARYLAAQWGIYPNIIYEETDLHNISRTAELIDRYQPDIVFNATIPSAIENSVFIF